MNAHSPSSMTAPLILRIISGRQKDAEYRLASGLKLRIGHAFDHDIVLRLPSARDTSLALDLTGNVPLLSVAAGTANVLGRPVSAGEQAQLPLYVPVTVGDASFAIGDPASDRWREAADFAAPVNNDADATGGVAAPVADDAAPAAPVSSTGIPPQINGFLQHSQRRLQPILDTIAFERRWPIYAVAAATLLIAVLIFNPVSSWIGQTIGGPQATQAALDRAGFKDLAVTQGPDGAMLVRGLVRDDAQLTRVRQLLNDNAPNAVVDVNTMDGLAAGVTDLLAAQGIDAEARPGRGRTLVVTSEYLPNDRQTELIAQIRKETPALAQVIFNIDTGRGEPALQYFFASDKYGIASFVEGDPSYIKTADGNQWFAGGVLPTGHVILDIGNGRARFERNGMVEEISFAPETTDPADANSVESTNEDLKKVATTERNDT